MTVLNAAVLPELQRAIADARVDGWLLYEFHGLNPIAGGLIGLEGLTTRRAFAWIPREGTPTAVSHAIEQGPWRNWPREWNNVQYSGWRSLEEHVAKLVKGKRVAMEYSPGDAVPYLDRVPAGVVEMVRDAGATVVSSADLVTRFYAVWTRENRESHERAARIIAEIARNAVREAAARAGAGPMKEFELREWILARFADRKVSADHGPIVAVNANAADPHYEPRAGRSAPIERGAILLIDLWAREDGGVYADQTWMASLGPPSRRAVAVWEAVRDARDAAIALLKQRVEGGVPVRGGEVDDAARGVIVERGFGEFFIHRTGHSIDARDLHGSGPHIDNLETREERALIPGVGFSIEPGVYLRGEIGMRSEVNALIGDRELIVTPSDYQRELLVV